VSSHSLPPLSLPSLPRAHRLSVSESLCSTGPRGTPDPELFAKRNAIRIYRPTSSNGASTPASSSTPSLEDTLGAEVAEKEDRRGLLHAAPWFFFVKSNTEMEE
jgi:hypothetical protein